MKLVIEKLLLLSVAILICSFAYGQEKLEVEGAIIIKDSEDPTPAPGTIRWTGSDFEGWNGVCWVSFTGDEGCVADVDDNTYSTLKIGTQEWMTENLRTSHYNDGIVINEVSDDAEWKELSSGAWCWYDNNNSFEIPYGKLYNFYAVGTEKLCPTGWHVPTDSEWTILADYLGGIPISNGFSVAGGRMKEAGVTHWNTPNTGATNDSGWSGLPGGAREANGSFIPEGYYGYWWSATPENNNPGKAWTRSLRHNNDGVFKFSLNDKLGLSVRCLKD